MVRAIASILTALSRLDPGGIGDGNIEIAQYISAAADEFNFDPFTLVAFVDVSSNWYEQYLSDDYARVGLGNINLRNYKACQEDLLTSKCAEVTESLMNWRFNLQETSRAFVTSRLMCSEVMGTDLAAHWLNVLTGEDAALGTICGHDSNGSVKPIPARVKRVLALRRQLELATE